MEEVTNDAEVKTPKAAQKLKGRSPRFKFAKTGFLAAARRFNTSFVLVVLLMAAAYFIGSMKTEIAYLKKGSTLAAAGQGATNPAPAGPGQFVKEPSAPVEPLGARDHVRGDRNAKLLMIEYSDLECPFCKNFHSTMKQILADYPDVAWAYRHYPLDFHANAQKEAEASECVAELGGEEKFWEFVDNIFERTTSNGTGFALDELAPLAAELGLDQAEVQNCIDSDKYQQLVKDQFDSGAGSGVTGTPGTFFITDDDAKLIAGALPIEQIKQQVEEMLK